MKESGTFNMMYVNALHGLANGCLMPWDKEVLATSPLPVSVIEPYTTKEVPDVLESMNLTFSAMSIWIDEAKKVNYFSERFVTLSKKVRNGVTTMGRGLVTLHQRGEDLTAAPMSIGDLIGVASYHFRKSYLGVLQTSRSHPELGEKLLMNQIGWNDMLMRLFKTRDKLENSECGIRNAELAGAELKNEEGRMKKEELASGSALSLNSNNDDGTIALPAASERAFNAPSAFGEPGAFAAPRAFSSYDRKSRTSGSQSLKHGETYGTSAAEKTISSESDDKGKQENLKSGNKMNETPEEKNITPMQKKEAPEQILQKCTETGNDNQVIEKRKVSDEENGTLQNEKPESGNSETENKSAETPENKDPEDSISTAESQVPEIKNNEIPDPENRNSEIPAEKNPPQGNIQAKGSEAQAERENTANLIQTNREPPDEKVNPYLEMEIRTALKCDPKVWDEIKRYMRDPFFMRRHPEHAAVFRKLMREQFDSS